MPLETPVASRQCTRTSPSTLARSRGLAMASARPRTTDRAAAWIAPCLMSASLRAICRSSWICTRSLCNGVISLPLPASGARRRGTEGVWIRKASPRALMAGSRSDVRRSSALAPMSNASFWSAGST